jgi:hypothetical protein
VLLAYKAAMTFVRPYGFVLRNRQCLPFVKWAGALAKLPSLLAAVQARVPMPTADEQPVARTKPRPAPPATMARIAQEEGHTPFEAIHPELDLGRHS